MTRAEEFLDLYKKLEAIVASTYGARHEGGSVAKLGRRPEFRSISAELDYIRDVRNLLSHRPKISDAYMVEPSEAMVQLLKDVIQKVETPAVAGNIMVKIAGVFCCEKEDAVLPAVRTMYEKGISHIPIMEEGRVVGVFSDSTFIHCTVSGEYAVKETTVFREIEKELSFESYEPETFLFAGKDVAISELSDIFEEASRDGRKVGMIFVTEHGRDTEKLLGIITAWDVAAAY